jgi:hypothetical protein
MDLTGDDLWGDETGLLRQLSGGQTPASELTVSATAMDTSFELTDSAFSIGGGLNELDSRFGDSQFDLHRDPFSALTPRGPLQEPRSEPALFPMASSGPGVDLGLVGAFSGARRMSGSSFGGDRLASAFGLPLAGAPASYLLHSGAGVFASSASSSAAMAAASAPLDLSAAPPSIGFIPPSVAGAAAKPGTPGGAPSALLTSRAPAQQQQPAQLHPWHQAPLSAADVPTIAMQASFTGTPVSGGAGPQQFSAFMPADRTLMTPHSPPIAPLASGSRVLPKLSALGGSSAAAPASGGGSGAAAAAARVASAAAPSGGRAAAAAAVKKVAAAVSQSQGDGDDDSAHSSEEDEDSDEGEEEGGPFAPSNSARSSAKVV